MDCESKFLKPVEVVVGSSSEPADEELSAELQELSAELQKAAAALREMAPELANPLHFMWDEDEPDTVAFTAPHFEEAVLVIRNVDPATAPGFAATLFSLYGPVTRVVTVRDRHTDNKNTFLVFFAAEAPAKMAFEDFGERYTMQYGVGKTLMAKQELLRLELYEQVTTYAVTPDGIVEVDGEDFPDERMAAILKWQKIE